MSIENMISIGSVGATFVSAHTKEPLVCMNVGLYDTQADSRGHWGVMQFVTPAHARQLAAFLISAADACDYAQVEKIGGAS